VKIRVFVFEGFKFRIYSVKLTFSDFWMILAARDQVPKTSYVDWI
jgi:hypothetical protein